MAADTEFKVALDEHLESGRHPRIGEWYLFVPTGKSRGVAGKVEAITLDFYFLEDYANILETALGGLRVPAVFADPRPLALERRGVFSIDHLPGASALIVKYRETLQEQVFPVGAPAPEPPRDPLVAPVDPTRPPDPMPGPKRSQS